MRRNPSKSIKDLSGVLTIKDFVIPVKIGVTEQERKNPQDISIDLSLKFKKLPDACFSDKIDETICYDELCTTIKKFTKDKEFKLIEKLTLDITLLLKKTTAFSRIDITIRKKPHISGLKGYVSMELSSI